MTGTTERWVHNSVVTVVEFHSKAGGIQFTSKWTSSKDFLTSCKTVWLSAIKNWALNKPCLETKEINNDINKNCSLIQYSHRKTNFRKIKLNLDLENWHQKFKNAVFWQPSIKKFCKMSKNPLRMFIWMKKSIEFHLPHYEIPQQSSR